MDLNTKIQKNPQVNYTTVDNDIIIMSPEDHGYYRLNAVGAKIWELIGSSSLALEAIIHNVQNTYKISKEQAMQDTCKFIEMMIIKNIFVAAT